MAEAGKPKNEKADEGVYKAMTGRTIADLVATFPVGLLACGIIFVALVVGYQMVRGDALVCANGAIFAKNCAEDAPDPNPAHKLTVRNLREQVIESRRQADQAIAAAATRSPQLDEIEPSGPWGIKWKWISPTCEGGYNMVVEEGRTISVFGRSVKMDGYGEALLNGRFYVKFTIENGKYILTADGSIGSRFGEARLHEKANPDGEPYCQGPITITRGKLPEILVGGGNGN